MMESTSEPVRKRESTPDADDIEVVVNGDSPAKRRKLESNGSLSTTDKPQYEATVTSEPRLDTRKGEAPIKSDHLVRQGCRADQLNEVAEQAPTADDDDAERAAHDDQGGLALGGKAKKVRGQNKNRDFGSSRDQKGLCSTRVQRPEFSPENCQFGTGCRFEHDLRKYLHEYKREDLDTFDGVCPVWKAKGSCDTGWKCRFVGSHMRERDTEDGRKELVLEASERMQLERSRSANGESLDETVNVISTEAKVNLSRKRMATKKADQYSTWINNLISKDNAQQEENAKAKASGQENEANRDNRASYIAPPFLPSEKRRLYFGSETPVLAPLTTQGNLPFRRICVGLGAQATYSEMAMSMPVLQGQKSEWALLRAHSSETVPPDVDLRRASLVKGYDHSKDLRFGAQIAGNKPWNVLKVTEVLTALCPHLRVIDLNCGCPIDLVYKQGAGSALLEHPGKLEKMLIGMNAVSADIPISLKIRTGTKDKQPTALKLVNRLVYGSSDTQVDRSYGPSGVAAITLHGRSRQQRYTRDADWEYIASVAALIKEHSARGDELADTIHEPDARHLANTSKDTANSSPVFFLGNGDCYSHKDYTSHLTACPGMSTVMLARGALIKPWIFEEIALGQHIDKSATERLGLVEQFARFGLEHWGSDEHGVGTTRRFLLEWLSFAHRYVPVGLLERLPPRLQDRPPRYRGRSNLETLLASDDARDWIKISEMFLGPAHKDFRFLPKHKSNAYETVDAEG